MLSKVVPDVAGGVTEEKVTGKAFELVFAFDEVISCGGLRYMENVSYIEIVALRFSDHCLCECSYIVCVSTINDRIYCT